MILFTKDLLMFKACAMTVDRTDQTHYPFDLCSRYTEAYLPILWRVHVWDTPWSHSSQAWPVRSAL